MSNLTDDADFTLDEEELHIIEQLNDWRRARQLAPLSLNQGLCQASEWSARDMAERQQTDTTDSLGRSPAQRARAFGFPGTLASVDESEWVYASDAVGPSVFESLTSAQFNLGLPTMPAWRSIGIARVFNLNKNQWYWSVLFGAY